MKVGAVAQFCYRCALAARQLTFDQLVDRVIELGCQSIQLFNLPETPEARRALRTKLEHAHVDLLAAIGGIHPNAPRSLVKPGTDAAIAALDKAQEAGARTTRIIIHPFPRITRSGMVVQAIDELGRVAKAAEERGMVVGLETHHDGILSIYENEAIVRGVGSRALGITFDIGNVMTTFEDPALAARVFARYVVDAHAKDLHFVDGALTLAPFGEGYVPLGKVVQILHDVGYRGPLNIEASPDEGDEDAFLRHNLSYLRGLVARAAGGS
jgi:sugar phosphate isomerase/epimerase